MKHNEAVFIYSVIAKSVELLEMRIFPDGIQVTLGNNTKTS